MNLRLAAPIATWDEAIPLGNGTMGVLLWGGDGTLRLSLDRGDLWDERPSKRFTEVRDRFNWVAMQQMVASNRMAEFHDVFDSNYDYSGPPTKLPAGRVEIALEAAQKIDSFELNLATAEGIARLGGGAEVRVFVDAAHVEEPVALLRIPGPTIKNVRLLSPESVKKLGYAPPRTGEEPGWRWFEQEAAEGFSYAVCAGWKRVGQATLLAVTVATRREGKSPQAVARRRVEEALKAGFERRLVRHVSWWSQFWGRSSVSVPEPHILQHYHLVRYFYGAASRRGAPPMPLQGVWSADAGTLPPWKGDYHNDLNTQMTYLAYRVSGDFEEGASFLDFLWELLPTFRRFARDFYDAPGAAVPGVMSLAGQPLGGWGQYSLSPTMGAWNAHLFYLHWRHTRESKFLRERAYPFCREIGICLRALLRPDAKGRLVLPLSSSPEIFDNSRRAFLEPNTNYDLASLRMLFLALAEMATALGDRPAAQDWTDAAGQLGPFHMRPDGTLLLDASTPLPDSHRHLSNLLPIHPFNLITSEGGERDREIIQASLADWDRHGTRAWCGYSFSWMACLRARVGDAEAALRNLDIYVRAFILRNGFHANGDQTKSGFSSFTYRPFTLEGNFLAMEAVHEMLLQSWSAEPGQGGDGVIRIFPAMPWRWSEAAFEDLRAEGGHRVSARREQNATTWFRVLAAQDGVVRIRDNFNGRQPKWNRSGVRRIGDDFEVRLRRGAVLEATLPVPTARPAAPANLAEPVTIQPAASASPARQPVPVLHVTDLFRPHVDPDDHWDLACSFALARGKACDLRGVLIDFPVSSDHDPDVLAVSQLNQVTGLAVPVMVGSPRKIEAAQAQDAPARADLAGIHAFLRILREAPQPVTIHVLGSCRDLAIAAGLEPELFAKHCAAVYLNAGSGTREPGLAARLEYNVGLDPGSYAAIFRLPCPVYWLPCFEVAPGPAQPEFRQGEYGSFYRFRQDQILLHLSPRVQNYFAFMFKHGRPEGGGLPAQPATSDWLRFLLSSPDQALLARQGSMVRNMWCTAAFLHATGQTVLPDGTIVPIRGAHSPVFTFDPISIECGPDGVTRWTEKPLARDRFIFHVRDRDRYGPAMTAAMKTLLQNL